MTRAVFDAAGGRLRLVRPRARTAELHAQLTSDPRDPNFAPEPLTALDRQSLYHGARSLTRQVFHEVRSLNFTSPNVVKVLAREPSKSGVGLNIIIKYIHAT